MGIIETHAHIYSGQFSEDRDRMILQAFEEGIDQILMPNVDVDSIDKMLEVEAAYPQKCIAMMGLHPCSVKADFEKQLTVMEEWLDKRDFIAIGEIGMDLHWDLEFVEEQKEAFKIQVQWAKNRQLPIAIHARKANQELLEILEKEGTDDLNGVFHCFSGTIEEGQRVKDLGFYLGIGGVVTFKNGGLDKVIKELGFENIVLETDCPYLAPVPYRGKRNEVAYIQQVAEKIAHIFELSYEEVVDETTENAKKLFRL